MKQVTELTESSIEHWCMELDKCPRRQMTKDESELMIRAVFGEKEKAGFAKHSLAGYTEHFTYSKYIGGEVIRITALYDCDFAIILHGTARRVTYLHDLQNKIFAVTGQELEIELKTEQ